MAHLWPIHLSASQSAVEVCLVDHQEEKQMPASLRKNKKRICGVRRGPGAAGSSCLAKGRSRLAEAGCLPAWRRTLEWSCSENQLST